MFKLRLMGGNEVRTTPLYIYLLETQERAENRKTVEEQSGFGTGTVTLGWF